jgi:hypothetical protein
MAEKRLLAVFAHPVDETFRPGGTLALLAWRGVERIANPPYIYRLATAIPREP